MTSGSQLEDESINIDFLSERTSQKVGVPDKCCHDRRSRVPSLVALQTIHQSAHQGRKHDRVVEELLNAANEVNDKQARKIEREESKKRKRAGEEDQSRVVPQEAQDPESLDDSNGSNYSDEEVSRDEKLNEFDEEMVNRRSYLAKNGESKEIESLRVRLELKVKLDSDMG